MTFTKQETIFISIFSGLCLVYFVISCVADQIIHFSKYDELQAFFVPLLLYPSFHFSRKAYWTSTGIVFLTVIISDSLLMNNYSSAIRTSTIVLAGVVVAQEIIYRNARKQRLLKEEKEALADKLERTLDKVRRLSEILPMCGVCNQLRTDEEAWGKFEGFLKNELHVELIHGVCEKCLQEMMEDISIEKTPGSKSDIPLD